MLQKILSPGKYTCIPFDSLILGDKNDMNVFQDIYIWLGKPIRFECGKWKKKLLTMPWLSFDAWQYMLIQFDKKLGLVSYYP